MGLSGGVEVVVDADVHLHAIVLEPASAANRKVNRLGDAADPEESFVERDRQLLAAGGHGELHVVDAIDRHPYILSGH
jgi:hypothetical protein